jgi:hypothetical protein
VGYLGVIIELSIGNDIEELLVDCFAGQPNLSEVSFEPDSRVWRIGERAFFGSGLKSIAIPSTVETIEELAFGSCPGLAVVTFETNSRLSAIGYEAFSGCASLTTVWVPWHIRSIVGRHFAGNRQVEILMIETDSDSVAR